MLARSFTNQLLRDLKASWQKTALLGILLVIGLSFWVPMLMRAIGGRPSRPSLASIAYEKADSSASQNDQSADPAGATDTRSFSTWQTADDLLQSDPLVRSAEVAAIESDPFHIHPDQFPPPVLFAEEVPAEAERAGKVAANPSATEEPAGLSLKSTIVGVSRRAAFINRKLYVEGAEIRVNGESYVVKEIHPRRVLLTKGRSVVELRIAGRGESSEPAGESRD